MLELKTHLQLEQQLLMLQAEKSAAIKPYGVCQIFAQVKQEPLTLTVCSQVPGCLTNKVTVTTNSDLGQCTSCAEAVTCWKGIAATHMCMVDTCDRSALAKQQFIAFAYTNAEQRKISNVQLVVRFTGELQPEGANGPTQANISGNTVTFGHSMF